MDANVRTPEIQVTGGEKYGTKEVGEWIVDYVRKAASPQPSPWERELS